MKSKLLLFTGIIFLVVGILLKKITEMASFGLLLIIIGASFKLLYILLKIKSGAYRPGKELLFLILGLLLFFSGLYLRGQDESFINPVYLMVLGITLKFIFIIKFIQIIKSNKPVT